MDTEITHSYLAFSTEQCHKLQIKVVFLSPVNLLIHRPLTIEAELIQAEFPPNSTSLYVYFQKDDKGIFLFGITQKAMELITEV